MPKRQLFMAGNGPEGEQKEQPEQKEGQKQQGEYTPGDAKKDAAKVVAGGQDFLDKAEGLDAGTPRVEQKEPITESEMKQLSKGYPEVALEQDVVSAIKAQHEKENKGKDKSYQVMIHRDTGTYFKGGYEYVLVIDANHKPPERLFKSKEKQAEQKEDVKTIVDGVLANPKELKQGEKMYSEAYNGASPKPKQHGEYWESNPVDGKTYVVINDSNKYRVYEGVKKEA